MLSVEKLKTLLVGPGIVSADDFALAEAENKSLGQDLEEIILARDLVREDDLGRLVAEDYGVLYLSPKNEKIDYAVLSQIPERVARECAAVALDRVGESYRVGMRDPRNQIVKHLFEKRLGGKIDFYYLGARGFDFALEHYRGGLEEEIKKLVSKSAEVDLPKLASNELVVKLVDLILEFGYRLRASDIHLEPMSDQILGRFRIDGIMHDRLTLPLKLRDPIISRIKVMAKLRIDEHLTPQDGKLQFKSGGEPVDVRVSILPVTKGENLVLRILSEESRQFTLTDLGFREDDLIRLKRSIQDPHGLILVTGPTGSGKTTTVYSVMKILNTRDVHISTIEDPVEYEIKGVSQIQVNSKANLTFASGLRSIVRQDPDIIMVGEIRDEETASIAVNSAMTGHLVLSTFHANDSATAITRLFDMKVEPFLVASTVNIIIAERLVRRICASCRESISLKDEEVNLLKNDKFLKKIFAKYGASALSKLTIYRGRGCNVCGQTGFLGRVGIFEVLPMTNTIKSLVIARSSSGEIAQAAGKEGVISMTEDGIIKVLAGQTTLGEVLRATRT